jgi:hypothetical protein
MSRYFCPSAHTHIPAHPDWYVLLFHRSEAEHFLPLVLHVPISHVCSWGRNLYNELRKGRRMKVLAEVSLAPSAKAQKKLSSAAVLYESVAGVLWRQHEQARRTAVKGAAGGHRHSVAGGNIVLFSPRAHMPAATEMTQAAAQSMTDADMEELAQRFVFYESLFFQIDQVRSALRHITAVRTSAPPYDSHSFASARGDVLS